MSQPFAMYKYGQAVTPADGTDQPYYTRVLCLTAGNLTFRLLDNSTGVESANIVLAMTAGQTVDIVPKKVMATGTTGTYAGLMSA